MRIIKSNISSIEKLTGEKSMEMSFFALSSQQGPVQGRFKPTHRLITLSTMVAAFVRRFKTPTPLNYGRTESKKDISMLFIALLSCIALKQRSGSCAKERYMPSMVLVGGAAHDLQEMI